MVAAIAILAGAGAASPVTISLSPTALAFAPGADATVLIRVQAANPEGVSVHITVENGGLSGVVAPNLVSPGVAEGMAFVRRETNGVATVHARVNDVEVASTLVTFASSQVGGSGDFDLPLPSVAPDPLVGTRASGEEPVSAPSLSGTVAIQANLKADHDAAARVWRFEVVDFTGQVTLATAFSLSGDAPSAIKNSELPLGLYTVRPVLGQDAGHSCTAGKLFEISDPVRVVIPGLAEARFTIAPCPIVPSPVTVPAMAEPPTPPQATPASASVPERLAPLPPATGSGLTDGSSEMPAYVTLTIVLTLSITIAVAGASWLLAAHSRR